MWEEHQGQTARPPPLLPVMLESKGNAFLTVPRQPAHPLRSGSQICKDLWSLQKDQYYILNITIPFIGTILQQKHFILSWDPIKIDFSHLIGGLPHRSPFDASEANCARTAGPFRREAWGEALRTDMGCPMGCPGRADGEVMSGDSGLEWGEVKRMGGSIG